MIYKQGDLRIKVFASRAIPEENIHPMARAFFTPEMIQVQIRNLGSLVWINIHRNQLIRRSIEGIPQEFKFNNRLSGFGWRPDPGDINRIISSISNL